MLRFVRVDGVVSLIYVHVDGFLPDAMLSVVLVLIIKDKCGKINGKGKLQACCIGKCHFQNC